MDDEETSGGAEVAGCDGLEYLVDGLLGGDGAVEGHEVSLQPLGDVVPSPARVDHGRHVLDVCGEKNISNEN